MAGTKDRNVELQNRQVSSLRGNSWEHCAKARHARSQFHLLQYVIAEDDDNRRGKVWQEARGWEVKRSSLVSGTPRKVIKVILVSTLTRVLWRSRDERRIVLPEEQEHEKARGRGREGERCSRGLASTCLRINSTHAGTPTLGIRVSHSPGEEETWIVKYVLSYLLSGSASPRDL